MSRNIGPLLSFVSPSNAFYAASIADFSIVLTLAAEGLAESGQLSRKELRKFQDNLDVILDKHHVLCDAISDRVSFLAQDGDVIGIQTMIVSIISYRGRKSEGSILPLMFSI